MYKTSFIIVIILYTYYYYYYFNTRVTVGISYFIFGFFSTADRVRAYFLPYTYIHY